MRRFPSADLKSLKRERAFTLIELLAVIAIIAILASLILGTLMDERIRQDIRRVFYWSGTGLSENRPRPAKQAPKAPTLPTPAPC